MGKSDWIGFVYTVLFYIPPTMFAWLLVWGVFALLGVSHPAAWLFGLAVIPVWMVSVIGWVALRLTLASRRKD